MASAGRGCGVTELLVPFFLAGIGLHVDLSSFAQAGTAIPKSNCIMCIFCVMRAGCERDLLDSVSIGHDSTQILRAPKYCVREHVSIWAFSSYLFHRAKMGFKCSKSR